MKLASTVIASSLLLGASSLLLGMAIGLFPGAASAVDNNTGAKPPNTSGLAPNQGHILCTAAINSNGTIATKLSVANSYIDPTNTIKLGIGTYVVAFAPPCSNIQIANGWFRLVQRDTLTTGTLPAGSCIVADRGDVPSALFIQCYDQRGNLSNTSFTVSVSR
jgi:hypothetical protein